MKQLIDIPEEIMEYIKNNGCLSVIYNNEVVKAIINGTPVSTEGDLISREDLIEYIDDNADDLMGIEDVIEVIGNAPTVNDKTNAIKRDVWELYQRHQSHLATYVYEFGIELKELLDRYEGGRQ